MNQRRLALVATLIALVLVAGTSAAGWTADAPLQGQPGEEINVEAWLSETGSTDPTHRMAPASTEAEVHIESELDDSKTARIEVIDFRGYDVFRSATFDLSSGQDEHTVTVTGKAMLQGYLDILEEQKGEPIYGLDHAANPPNDPGGAIQVMEQEAAKDPCTFDPVADDPSLRTNPSRVAQHVNEVVGKARFVDTLLEQILRFDSLESGAEADLEAARTDLATVDTSAQAAIDKLQEPDDPPLCPEPLEYDIEIPDWEPQWDDVRADLDAALAAANSALAEINSAVTAIDENATRAFPVTAVANECNQNTVQLSFLRIVQGSPARWETATDFWWTVGTPGPAARIASPDNPSAAGGLSVRPNTIYASSVTVPGVATQSQVEAVVQDSQCVPVGAGIEVGFSAGGAAVVTLSSAQAMTDDNGMVQVTANTTAEVGDGTARIAASLEGEEQATVDIRVIGPAAQVTLRLAGRDVDRIPNFGIYNSVQVSAVIEDANGNSVADGTPVDFSIEPDDDHTFNITDPPVTTSGGRAVAQLVLGQATGTYSVRAHAGGVTDVQLIRVVGPPDVIGVTADPHAIDVNTPLPEHRQSQFAIEVMDSEGNPAPDSTILEFEIEPDSVAHVGGFPGLTQVEPGVYQTSNLIDGETQVMFLANGSLIGHYSVTVRVTALYGNNPPYSADTTVSLFVYNSDSQTIYLPLIGRN
jgi:hypothetical protein